MRKVAFLLVLCLILTLLLTACYMPSAEIEYAISEDGSHAVVTGIGSSAKGRVVIADTYEGKYVTEIAEGAFAADELSRNADLSRMRSDYWMHRLDGGQL